MVDGVEAVRARPVVREDLALHFGNVALTNCGFHLTIPTAGLPLGAHAVSVVARGELGEASSEAFPFEVTGQSNATPGPRIAVVSAMKSGSTFVATVLRRYFDVAEYRFGELAYAAWENNLDDRILDVVGGDPCVLKFHLKADPQNLLALRSNGIVPLVLHRNLADTIVSFDDHLRMRGGANRFGIDVPVYRSLSERARYRFLIENVLPWFVGFYVGWRKVGVALDRTKLSAALDAPMLAGESNRNVGRIGRSIEAFDDTTKALLETVVRRHFEPLEELIDELPWRRAGTPT